MAESVDDTVNIIQVFPDEFTDAGIAWYSFVSPIWGFIARGWALDYRVVEERLSNIQNFWFKNKGNITMEYGHSVGQSLGESGVPECTKGGLEACKVVRSNVECSVIIAYKKVEHGE